MDRVRPQEAFIYPSDQDQGPKSNKIKQEQREEKHQKVCIQVKRIIFENSSARKNGKYPKKVCTTPTFVSRNQLFLEGLESPFDKRLNPESRLVA